MMNTKQLVLGALLAASFGAANAGTIQIGGGAASTAGKMSTKSGVCTFTFDSASTCSGAQTVTGNFAASNIVTGNVSGVSAAPAGDTSAYLNVGPSRGTPITFTVSGLSANYFGFFGGSLDTYNLVQFYLNGTLVDSFTGTQINAVAFPGSQTTGNEALAQYIDYFTSPGVFYNSVVISSTSDAFELDNLAIGRSTPLPEPGSVALLGLGAIGLLAARRRKA